MSFDVSWNINDYREEHESDEHWELRKCFMERWKGDYPEDRLVCLARVFVNMELLGCRYPQEVMREVARLSHEIAQKYRNLQRNKLKRTFVSASDAAEDRAKGVRREGGIVIGPPVKASRVDFVPQGHVDRNKPKDVSSDEEERIAKQTETPNETVQKKDIKAYQNELMNLPCLDVRSFNEQMFRTEFGPLVLLVRPWASKYNDLQASCQACGLTLETKYENEKYTFSINGKLLSEHLSFNKVDSRQVAEAMAWNRLRNEIISVIVKEQWISQGDRISVNDVSNKKSKGDVFGTPVDNSVATKMMKLMGWKGGGLGADAQGIAEPIKPNLQMVNRAGLGSHPNAGDLRRAAQRLMQRYIASDVFDLDLVFSTDFSKEERAQLHQVAKRAGLASKSYGVDTDRFLVVKKKLDPFSLVRAVIEKGGETDKYKVFIPVQIKNR